MIYVLAVAVAVLGLLVTILASLTVYTADRLAKEAEKNVKLAMKLVDMAGKNNVQDLANDLRNTRSHVETLVSALATEAAKQEEDIKKLRQVVAVLESKTEPDKRTSYTGETYKEWLNGN